MVKRMTPAQARAALRRAQSQQRQAVAKYNREVDKYNRSVKKAVNDYNREARAHNARVRSNRQKLQRELNKLQSQTTTTTYVTYGTSVRSLATAFDRVDEVADREDATQSVVDFAEMSEAETANSVEVLNALLDQSPDVADDPAMREPSLVAELSAFSEDLVMRWKGALFSLNPANPDAARHFCTSAREILTLMIQSSAPDKAVLADNPNCDLMPQGTPSRRAKVRYLLAKKGLNQQEIEDFVEGDLDNVIELFKTFNDGTHGAAGKFTVRQLLAIRTRVESAIQFLHGVAR
ncbi:MULTISPECIES: hypothetical protein [unclassified Nocardioides]|uniref:pPIWI-associating nuclease domain-containing protein n=1 Tax=unclassified Nocardioides TaxID=2615069 RepID=UPI00362102E2